MSSKPETSSEVPDGRRARGDQTRARILAVSLDAASRNGLNGVTIGQVAEAAAVSKGHIAVLFGNRESLQLATIDAAIARYRGEVWAAVERARSPHEKLRRACLGWFGYVESRVLPGGCLITAATSEFRTIEGAIRERLLALRKEQVGLLERLAAEAIGVTPGEHETRHLIDDFVYDVIAYRAAANVSALLGDRAAFEHARRKTKAALETLLGQRR